MMDLSLEPLEYGEELRQREPDDSELDDRSGIPRRISWIAVARTSSEYPE